MQRANCEQQRSDLDFQVKFRLRGLDWGDTYDRPAKALTNSFYFNMNESPDPQHTVTGLNKGQWEQIAGIAVVIVMAGGLVWQILRSRAPKGVTPVPVQLRAVPTVELAGAEEAAKRSLTPEAYLNLSLAYHRAKRFGDAVIAAQQALKLRPSYAEAWNNIAASYADMEMWDESIESAQKALALNPNFSLARNNLAWAQAQKAKVQKITK